MAFRFISPDSLPWIDLAESARAAGAVEPREPYGSADAGAKQLRTDYGRVSRWALGLLGTAVVGLGILLLSLGIDLASDSLLPPPERALGAAVAGIIGCALAAGGGWLLWALHRTGRRLAIGVAFWSALPYRTGRRSPEARDWFVVRFLGYEPDLLLRIVTSALGLLASVFAVSMIFYSIAVVPSGAGVVGTILSSILFIGVTLGQFGGVQRIQNAYAHRDPWWATLRGRR